MSNKINTHRQQHMAEHQFTALLHFIHYGRSLPYIRSPQSTDTMQANHHLICVCDLFFLLSCFVGTMWIWTKQQRPQTSQKRKNTMRKDEMSREWMSECVSEWERRENSNHCRALVCEVFFLFWRWTEQIVINYEVVLTFTPFLLDFCFILFLNFCLLLLLFAPYQLHFVRHITLTDAKTICSNWDASFCALAFTICTLAVCANMKSAFGSGAKCGGHHATNIVIIDGCDNVPCTCRTTLYMGWAIRSFVYTTTRNQSTITPSTISNHRSHSIHYFLIRNQMGNQNIEIDWKIIVGCALWSVHCAVCTVQTKTL